MKKLSIALMVVTGLLMAAPTSGAVPPPSFPIMIFPDGVDSGCYFSNGTRHGGLGSGPGFDNLDSKARTVRQSEGFWNVKVAAGATKRITTHAAGSYVATCDGGHATVVYRTAIQAPAAPLSPWFVVTWADASAGARSYDVQYRIGTGNWQTWKHGTSVRSAIVRRGRERRTVVASARVRQREPS